MANNVPTNEHPRSHWLPVGAIDEGFRCFYMQTTNRACLLLNNTCNQKNSFGQCVHDSRRDVDDSFDAIINDTHIDCCHSSGNFTCQTNAICRYKGEQDLCTRGVPISRNTRGPGSGAIRSRPYVVDNAIDGVNPPHSANVFPADPSIPLPDDLSPALRRDFQQALREFAQEAVDAPNFDPLEDDPEYIRNPTQRSRVSGITSPSPLLKIECRDTDCKWNNKDVCFSIRVIMDQEHRCQCFETKDHGTDKEYTDPISNIDL